MELDFSTIQNRLKTLEGIPLFDSMKREDVLDLLRESGAYVHRYRKGEYILLDAENASCICLVLDGIVHMVKENSRGHEALLLYMKRGEVFGETFVFRREPISRVSFRAARSCTILFLPFRKLQTVTERGGSVNIQFARNMYAQICDKNFYLMQKLEMVSMDSLRDKIMVCMKIEAERAKSSSFTLPLNRTELAQYLCSNRSSLTRELSSMKRDGLLDYAGNSYSLLTV